MLAWSEGTLTDVRKPEIMVMASLWAETVTDYSDHPRKLVTLNPKLKSTGAGRYQLLSRWWDARTSTAWPERLLRKVRTLWHCSRLRSVALYLWLIVVISVRQSTVAAISASCRALVMVSSSMGWQPDCKIQRSERNGQRDWCMSRVTAIISALVICIIVCLSWAVNHYRDNAITYKAQRDKNARELKLANAAITDMQMRQRDVAALDAKYEVKWC